MTNHTEARTTHQLRTGDIVLAHGMRLVIDQGIDQTRHPINEYSPTLATRARIDNWDELVAGAKAGRSDYQFIVGLVNDDPNHQIANGQAPDTEPRWTIQGNRLAQWAVVTD